MRITYYFIFLFVIVSSSYSKNTKSKLSKSTDSFYNPKINYGKFPARVTDISDGRNIFKLISENKNVKFFRVGDYVKFHINGRDKDKLCEGYLRGVEENYFMIGVKNLAACWDTKVHFRRGMQLIFYSDILAKRVKEGSIYRNKLINRRKSYLSQLNSHNHFLWNFKQKELEVAAEYDKKIIEVQKRKANALREIIERKSDAARLQQILIKKLDNIDKDLVFYRVEPMEFFTDNWSLDQHLGLPMEKSPSRLREEKTDGSRYYEIDFN